MGNHELQSVFRQHTTNSTRFFRAESSLFGCTDLLTELGILRTRAGVWRQRASHASPPARRPKDYDYAVVVARRRRLSPPAPRPGSTSGRPGAAWSAPVRPVGTRRPGPMCSCSRLSVHALASGGPLRDRRRAAGRVLASSLYGQRAEVPFRAGSRDSDRRSGRLTVEQSSGRAVPATVIWAGARARRCVIPDRRRLSTHRQSASRPRGHCDCHPGRGRACSVPRGP